MDSESDSPEKTCVLVLLSGGVDSSSCVQYYVDLGFEVSALFLHYGQPNADEEQTAAKAIADFYSIPLRQLTLSDCGAFDGYVPGRNSLLLCLGLMQFQARSGIVALGIHSGTAYTDCSPEFLLEMQRVFDLYEDGRIRIDAPFLHWTKGAIWEYANQRHVPLHLIHSSYSGQLGRQGRQRRSP